MSFRVTPQRCVESGQENIESSSRRRSQMIMMNSVMNSVWRSCRCSSQLGRTLRPAAVTLQMPKFCSYEGDGKTTVSILNSKYDHDLMLLDTFGPTGFRLSTGLFVVGPVAVFPRTIFQWDVNSVSDISEEALSLFWMVVPKLELLIIGVGDQGLDIDPKVRLFLERKKISVEVLPTSQAVPTFNFMNVDNRNVAAALIPPLTLKRDVRHDGMDSTISEGNLFKNTKELEKGMEQSYSEMYEDMQRQLKLFQQQKKPPAGRGEFGEPNKPPTKKSK